MKALESNGSVGLSVNSEKLENYGDVWVRSISQTGTYKNWVSMDYRLKNGRSVESHSIEIHRCKCWGLPNVCSVEYLTESESQ